LLDAAQDSKVTEATINASPRRVLELVGKRGRFEKPDDRNGVYIDSPERDELITTAAAESTVLLKNHGGVLPLKQNSKVMVIGQHAAAPTVGGGGSAKVDSGRSISPLTGLKEAGFVFYYEPGVPVFGTIPLPDPESIISACINGPEYHVRASQSCN
jgi:beta-glucosidase